MNGQRHITNTILIYKLGDIIKLKEDATTHSVVVTEPFRVVTSTAPPLFTQPMHSRTVSAGKPDAQVSALVDRPEYTTVRSLLNN